MPQIQRSPWTVYKTDTRPIAVGCLWLDSVWLYEIVGALGHPVLFLPDPFDVAAEGVGERRGDRPSCQVLGQGIVQVVDRHVRGIHGVIDAAPGVYQLPVLVKDIEESVDKVGRRLLGRKG